MDDDATLRRSWMESRRLRPAGGTTYDELRVGCVDDANARVLRVVHISDTHDDADLLDVPPGDVLIHSGDFFHWRSSYDFDADIARLNNFFAAQPHRHKVNSCGIFSEFPIANFIEIVAVKEFRKSAMILC